ncbi:hypothetical protein RRG08_052808 [Elysia crispata]|uniref:Uncharacterized protein n=1 Tax=Elysia crispata TaxID=231223 RepID=A0AAE1B723_9GAST|nr:hypothetical protein RRG08_052808 [Elysia crispata]
MLIFKTSRAELYAALQLFIPDPASIISPRPRHHSADKLCVIVSQTQKASKSVDKHARKLGSKWLRAQTIMPSTHVMSLYRDFLPLPFRNALRQTSCHVCLFALTVGSEDLVSEMT